MPRYCSACGSTRGALRLGHHWRCADCRTTDWQNPLAVAHVAVQRDEAVLLVRPEAAGGWSLPGAPVEPDETPWQTAARVVREVARLVPHIEAMWAPLALADPHRILMPFLATAESDPHPVPGFETRWAAIDDLPGIEVASREVAPLLAAIRGEPPTRVFREVARPGRTRGPFNFCVRCGSPLGVPDPDAAVRCPACGHAHKEYPRPTAGFLPIRERRVLLGRRPRGRDGGGRWACPSGHMEPGEAPGETAERELFEETGVRAHAERFVGIFASGDHQEMLYTGPVTDTSGTASSEFEELRWFTGSEAAALDGHHGTPDLIRWARREGLLD